MSYNNLPLPAVASRSIGTGIMGDRAGNLPIDQRFAQREEAGAVQRVEFAHWEELLNEALVATFPASDPVSTNRFD